MTDSLRDRISKRMQDALEAHTARVHTAVPIVVPTGILADAAIEEMSQGKPIPRVPAYDAEYLAARRFTGMSADLATDPPVELQVRRADDVDPGGRPMAELLVTLPDGTRRPIPFSPADAEELAVLLLSAVDGG